MTTTYYDFPAVVTPKACDAGNAFLPLLRFLSTIEPRALCRLLELPDFAGWRPKTLMLSALLRVKGESVTCISPPFGVFVIKSRLIRMCMKDLKHETARPRRVSGRYKQNWAKYDEKWGVHGEWMGMADCEKCERWTCFQSCKMFYVFLLKQFICSPISKFRFSRLICFGSRDPQKSWWIQQQSLGKSKDAPVNR